MRKFLFTALSVMDGIDSRSILKYIEGIGSQNDLIQFQQDKLKSLILHAYNNTLYYRDVFDRIHLVQNNQVDLARFGEIPILTKEIIRQHSPDLISRDFRRRKWYYDSSGGSTGEPIQLMQDRLYRRWGDANYYYWYKDLLGIDEIDAKKVILWGSMRDLLKGDAGWKSRLANWSKNIVFLNSFRMTENDMRRYISILNSHQPELIRGYASSLYELCRFAQREGLSLYRPRILVSAADMLTPEMRLIIERSFNCKVYDFYGSREINSLAGECREGLLHILSFHCYFEVLDKNNHPVKEGEKGKVILTNLHNYSMPMIRYEIGDMATSGPARCECGSILPTLKAIDGRSVDHLVRADGTLISPHVLTLGFTGFDSVKEFQVVQMEYNLVRILIVPNGVVKESEKRSVEEKVFLSLGNDCKVKWEFVSEIPRTAQGKFRYVKSLVPRSHDLPDNWR